MTGANTRFQNQRIANPLHCLEYIRSVLLIAMKLERKLGRAAARMSPSPEPAEYKAVWVSL